METGLADEHPMEKENEMTNKPIKVYDLFSTYKGCGWSPNTADYRGVRVTVAAVSIRQAIYFAANRVWADFDDDYPTGILEAYRREGWPDHPGKGWYAVACGHLTHDGLRLRHGKGITEIRRGIARHEDLCTSRR